MSRGLELVEIAIKNPTRIVTESGNSWGLDISPASREAWVVFGGFGEDWQAMQGLMAAFVDRNKRLIVAGDPQKRYPVPESLDPDHFTNTRSYLASEFLKQQGVSGANGYGHSRGAIETVYTALVDPQRFKGNRLVLDNPGGIYQQNYWSILSGYTLSQLENLGAVLSLSKDRGPLWQDVKSGVKYMARNPYETIWKEGHAIARSDVRGHIERLHDEHNIETSVVASLDDKVFKEPRLWQSIIDANIPVRYKGAFGGHFDLHARPEERLKVIFS